MPPHAHALALVHHAPDQAMTVEQEVEQKTECNKRKNRREFVRLPSQLERLGHELEKCDRNHSTSTKAQHNVQVVAQA